MMKKERPAGEDLKKYKLFTIAELVPLLGLSKASLRWFIKSGKLEGALIAGKIRVSQAALDKFLASPEKAAAEPRAARAARKAAKAAAAESFCELFPDEGGEK